MRARRRAEAEMGHPAGKKEDTRTRIVAGAGRAFRRMGYGAGVDGLAKAAGVTSGAFYTHFSSKADVFREAVVAGLRELQSGVRGLQATSKSRWLRRFVDFYVSEKRTCAPSESCALQSLTGEVARADDETRAAYETELAGVIDATAAGIDADSRRERRRQAIVLLALLSGGVSLSRAVLDPARAAEIADAVRAECARFVGRSVE